MKNNPKMPPSFGQRKIGALFLPTFIALFVFAATFIWQPSASTQHANAPNVTVQPAILAAAGASLQVVDFLDPRNAPASQNLVSGIPSNANPQGVAFFGSDNGLIADIGNSRIFVTQVSTGALLSTIDTSPVGYRGGGTIAVSPDQTTALAMGSAPSATINSLYVIRAPFNSSSALTPVAMPGSVGSFQTEAIVFSNAGRAFVNTTAGISVLDAPYTAVTFTIPFFNNSGSIAVTPNGNTILFTDLNTNSVGVYQAPFSGSSVATFLDVPGGVVLDGIAIAPNGQSAIVVDNGSHFAAGIAAPFSSGSTVSTIPLPAGNDQFEDVGISADSQLAILAGGSILEPAILIRAPFNSSAVTSNVPISGVANTSRGRGSVRFQPAAAASSVQVSGRITTPDGRSLRNAIVRITDQNNIIRTVTTNSFGFYTFDNVPTGQNYTISVFSKRYRFSPRVVQVNDTLANIDFVGIE